MTYRRGLVALALPILLVTCSGDLPSGAGGPGFAKIALHAEAPPSLQLFAPSLVVEQVRAVLLRLSQRTGDTIATRTVPFDVNQNSLNVAFNVVLSSAETLTVVLEYQTLLGQTLFSAQQQVVAAPGLTSSPPALQPSYVGPGGNVVFLALTPLDTTITAGDSVAYGVTAFDASQQPVPDFYLSWSSSDSRVPVNAAGVVRAPNLTALLSVTAQTPNGTTASTSLTILAPTGLTILPDSVEKLPGGTEQFRVVGVTGPFTWSVNGIDGGNSTFGTVDPNGFYQAPAAVPTPSTFPVCARVTATPASSGCAVVVINPVPSPGADVIVVNDLNVLDVGLMAADPNNRLFAANLVNYPATGPRANGTGVIYDRGRNSPCLQFGDCGDPALVTLDSVLTANGFTITRVDTMATWNNIPSTVKVIILWNPGVAYGRDDINGFKAFAAQGGRIVFIGEHIDFYGQAGLDTENQFLADMGAQFTNVGAVLACPETIVPPNIAQHQTTTGMTSVTIACASQAIPGPNDFPLFIEATGSAIAGVAKISTVPLPAPPGLVEAPTVRTPAATQANPRVNAAGKEQ
jgi:hypothetical protein